jgi:hypothetical protein
VAERGILAGASLAAVLGVLLAVGAAETAVSVGAATPTIDPDALWDIVSTCIDREGAPDAPFCGCKAFLRSCCGDPATPNDAVVWAKRADFVAIRNLNMCGCGGAFVAGLALPQTRVPGSRIPPGPKPSGALRGELPATESPTSSRSV